jgi:hypothetical protein
MSHINDNAGYEYDYFKYDEIILRKNAINMWEWCDGKSWVYVRLTDLQKDRVKILTKDEAFLELV